LCRKCRNHVKGKCYIIPWLALPLFISKQWCCRSAP
jgi:hypothetical protein